MNERKKLYCNGRMHVLLNKSPIALCLAKKKKKKKGGGGGFNLTWTLKTLKKIQPIQICLLIQVSASETAL